VRAYTVAATAIALRVPPKWLDNTLSHFKITGVTQTRQGISRRLDTRSILILEIAIRLTRALGTPLSIALDIAERFSKHSGSPTELEGGLTLSLDFTQVETDLLSRLAHAVESAPAPRRGRPPY
jgi:hypothetical protein